MLCTALLRCGNYKMPVYQSEPNFNFCYWIVGTNSSLTFVSGNIYMERVMEYMWNTYNILVIRQTKTPQEESSCPAQQC